MERYFVLLQSRTHALVLANRFNTEGIPCELTYMPRELMQSLCNLGVIFRGEHYARARNVVNRSGLPGCKVYRETMTPNGSVYQEVIF